MELEERLLNGKLEAVTGSCWRWKGEHNEKGYGRMRVLGKNVRVHRLAYELWVGEIPAGKLVCHSCDVRDCFNPEHLFVGTASENTHDMLAKGRGAQQSKPNGKLTADKVRAIREKAGAGVPQISLAARYKVSTGMISLVVSRKAWSHVA